MAYQSTPYTLPLVFTFVVAVAMLAYTVWRADHDDPDVEVLAFLVLVCGTAVWTGEYLLQLSSTTLEAKVLWNNFDMGSVLTVGGWFLLAAAYTGRDWLLERKWIAVALGPPLFTGLVMTPTNPLHGLLYRNPRLEVADGGFLVLAVDRGLWYSVDLLWHHFLTVAGIYFVARMILLSDRLYTGQAVAMGAAAVIPLLANGAFFLGVGPGEAVDLTPATFSVTLVLFGVGIFRYEMLDVVPVARDRVIENMHDGYLVVDDEDTVVDCNPAARAVVRDAVERGDDANRSAVDPDGIVGASLDDVFAGLEFVDAHAGTDRTEGEFVVEGGPDDPARYVVADSTPIHEDGDFLGRLVAFREVTERRTVEKRYQRLIEESTDMITILDPDGTVQYQSPSVRRVLGYDPADVEGTSALAYVHPEDREDLVGRLAGGDDDTVRFEVRLRDADGEYRTVEATGRSLLSDPVVGGIVVNHRDVTERKERERELERQNERLDEFASVVSHDLRNPLTVAEGDAATLEDELDGPQREYLAEIRESHDRMETIVEDVLALARQGDDVTDPEAVSLAETARLAWGTVATDDATLSVSDATVRADPDRLRQLLENLFRNAVEHAATDDGSGPDEHPSGDGDAATERAATGVAVTVGPTDRGFFVADDGPGIPPEEREDAFESGYTTSEDGTGFGLAIVERIASAHGWTASVTDADGGGARFEFAGARVDGETGDTVPVTEDRS